MAAAGAADAAGAGGRALVVVRRHVATRLLVANSLYDTWQLSNIVHLPCISNITSCQAEPPHHPSAHTPSLSMAMQTSIARPMPHRGAYSPKEEEPKAQARRAMTGRGWEGGREGKRARCAVGIRI